MNDGLIRRLELERAKLLEALTDVTNAYQAMRDGEVRLLEAMIRARALLEELNP